MEITGNPSLARTLNQFNQIESIPAQTRCVFNDAACNGEKLLVLSGGFAAVSAIVSIVAGYTVFIADKPVAPLIVSATALGLTALFGVVASKCKKVYDETLNYIISAIQENGPPLR